jgi:hypothetical protein
MECKTGYAANKSLWNAWMDRNHIKTKNVNMGWVSAQKIALQATRIVFT